MRTSTSGINHAGISVSKSKAKDSAEWIKKLLTSVLVHYRRRQTTKIFHKLIFAWQTFIMATCASFCHLRDVLLNLVFLF